MTNDTVAQLIAHFGFDRIPIEGTLYKRTYTCKEKLPDGVPAGTAIIGMYCREPHSASTFHKVSRDETWHFYSGDPFRLYLLYPDGHTDTVTMGADVLAGHRIQFTVPAGVWQAGELTEDGGYALFGCTVNPGFTGDCFEAGERSALLEAFPAMREQIMRLTPEQGPLRMPQGYNG